MDSIIENFNIIRFESLESTNKESVKRVNYLEAFDRDIVISSEQTVGYGKQNREWSSPIGNLYATISLKVDDSFELSKQYVFLTSLAIRQALSVFVNSENVKCKWPNDVLIGGKKISGTLLETAKDSKNQNWLIIGFGVNVNVNPKTFADKSVCLNDIIEEKIEINLVLKRILSFFNYYHKILKIEGFDKIKEIWLSNCYKLNQKIEIISDEKKYKGSFIGINEKGELLLDCNEKQINFQSCDVLY